MFKQLKLQIAAKLLKSETASYLTKTILPLDSSLDLTVLDLLKNLYS